MFIELKLAYDYKEEVKELFEEYTNMLIKSDKKFAKYLKIQNYDSEVKHLECKYGHFIIFPFLVNCSFHYSF